MSSRTRGALGLTWPDAGMAVKTMRVTGASWLLGAPSCYLTVSHAIRSLTCPIESELRDPIGVRTLLSHLRHRHHRDLTRQGVIPPRRPARSAPSRYQDRDPRAPCSVATPSKPRPRGARPIGLDPAGHLGRNVIERGYGDVKQWRGLATR